MREPRSFLAPVWLRSWVRADEIWLTLLSAILGGVAALWVIGISTVTLMLHRWLYGVAYTPTGHLSGLDHLSVWRTVLALTLGGLAVGVFGVVAAVFVPRQPVDPIEANALHGGRMSLRDSLVVVGQTILSNGSGASIGLEAGFTQIGSACASWAGRAFRVRRDDLRVLVGAGAGAAIGAAFNAPVTGAFYAFELVIGSYTLASLPPVAAAALAGVGVAHVLHHNPMALPPLSIGPLDWNAGIGVVLISVLSALTAIAVMFSVTQVEKVFRRLPVPGWGRPALGGLAVSGLAVIHPSVLSSGHEAMRRVLSGDFTPRMAAGLLLLKAVASALSIGSGFRGGLFFASLYLGTLAGTVYTVFLTPLGVAPGSMVLAALVGMSAMAVAVIGSPMTMVCLALEMTGSAVFSGATFVAAIISLLTVRRLFGYSFATWRFHLRGESIRSAVDVGWIRSLDVRRMMRPVPRSLPLRTSVARAQKVLAPGSGQRVILLDDAGRYAGVLGIADLHLADGTRGQTLEMLAQHGGDVLTPLMNVREAIELFTQAEADALVVVDDVMSRKVVGLLTEQHALRRYAEELERSRRSLAGEESFPT
ncbi:chloride channel protein [Neokomagataea anthophila]|uniref:Chloride channel protein n=1 Tax=Neokomagataea anthophila TaxID=2826925 RepID=A0ABS5E4J3_9PROT|nr:chloride channel protein [Neokomagataea anthophila]MBR0558822.1 chloride channel protein [Neokomagataea anthophila]